MTGEDGNNACADVHDLKFWQKAHCLRIFPVYHGFTFTLQCCVVLHMKMIALKPHFHAGTPYLICSTAGVLSEVD